MPLTPEQESYMDAFNEHLLRPILHQLMESLKGNTPYGGTFPGFENPMRLPADFNVSNGYGVASYLPNGKAVVFTLTLSMKNMSAEELSDFLEEQAAKGVPINMNQEAVQG